ISSSCGARDVSCAPSATGWSSTRAGDVTDQRLCPLAGPPGLMARPIAWTTSIAAGSRRTGRSLGSGDRERWVLGAHRLWSGPQRLVPSPCSKASPRAGDRRNLGDSESPVRPGAERLDGGRGTVPAVPCRGVVEADGHLERTGVRADHLRALPAGAEANATVGRDLNLHAVEPLRARDGVLRVVELEEAAVLHEAPGRDAGAEDVGPVLRADLQDDVVCERVHPEPGERGVQVEPGGVARA